VPTSGLALARPSLEAAFTALETTYPGEAALAARAATSGADLLTVLHSVKAILGTTASSGTGLAGQLDMVSKLIKGGLPTRVYVVSAPGFDTHVTEKQNHQRLMTEIDGAITTFVRGMHGDPHGQNVVLMTFSEFGRRVAENASGGTDHGSASPLFVAGPAVRGGYYGEEPSLTDLDSGNLKFTTDFRSVYATVLSKVVRTDPARVLGGTFPELNFV
jgi:uncharacterized protein (DUF1501 family)